MSSSKKQSREVRIRNYSFSNNQSSLFSAADNDKAYREPLRQTEIIHNYSPSRFEADSGMKKPNQNPQPSAQVLYALAQQEEIRKLEEVIYYLTGDKDMLRQQCATLQLQLSSLATTYSKQKESYEAQIRKLKQIVKDKDSQCESVSRNLKKQREIFEQQNERMKTQLKLLIEKKNDELYAITRQKETQNQQIKKHLELIIEQLKSTHRKQLQQKDRFYSGLNQEITLSKEKVRSLEDQIAFNDESHQSQKLKLIQNHQIFLSDLKESYHRTKIQLIQAAKDEVQAVQNNSQIQREAFLLQIQGLKKVIERQCIQNKELHDILFEQNRKVDRDTNEFLGLIKQLQGKLSTIYEQKQQELQFLKVKAAHLHSKDLESARNIFQIQINHLVNKYQILQQENGRLKDAITQAKNRYTHLTAELLQRDSLLHQQIANLKLKHSQACQQLKQQFEREKASVIKDSNNSQKELQSKQSKILSQEQELKKLRKLIANKSKQVDQLERVLSKTKEQFISQTLKRVKEAEERQNQWSQQKQNLNREIASKAKQIQKANSHLQELANITLEYDYTHLESEINKLRATIKERTEQSKNWKQKAEELQHKLIQLQSHLEQTQIRKQKEQLNSSSILQSKTKETIKDIEHLYQRKLEPINRQRQRLANQRQDMRNTIQELESKYTSLENNFKQLMESIRKKSELQERIVVLGLDTNLVKNKHQLFHY